MDGQILAGDESHKTTKSIRVTDAKAFQGVYTMVNEFNQVVLQIGGFLSFFSCEHLLFVRIFREAGHSLLFTSSSVRNIFDFSPFRAAALRPCTISISSVPSGMSPLELWAK